MSGAVYLEDIPYRPDSCAYFERLRPLPGAAFLDSSFPHSNRGRFDIMTAWPMSTALPVLTAGADERSTRDYFSELAAAHDALFAGVKAVSVDIPFCGGILGYISYDAGNRLHGIGRDALESGSLSSLAAYDWCLIQDHLRQRAALVFLPGVSPARRGEIHSLLLQPSSNEKGRFSMLSGFAGTSSEQAYKTAFDKIQAYIQAGDCYQVNLAQHFQAEFDGDPWHAYQVLRGVAAAPYSAFLPQGNDANLLCLSPERFLALHGQRVETAPIKGTRPRYADPAADKLAAEELSRSEKDRAENLMIVDLLRNDIGRNCIPGSIHVDNLFELQSFRTVHHLVSTIRGELREGSNAWKLLCDAYPGGSITGAPKRRAMQIIADVEQQPRGPYCGSVLYVSADGRMDSNIAIRSIWSSAGSLQCWAGGGIVADSQWQAEYQETFDKVGRILNALENDPTG